MKIKVNIALANSKRILITEEGIIFTDYEKKDEFSLAWKEVWDAADNWRE